MIKLSNFSRPYSRGWRSLNDADKIKNETLIEDLIKCEKEIENQKRLIGILDERAGPAIVSDNESSGSDTMPIPAVEHEVEQRDPLFAKSFTYTTNVSIKLQISN